MFIFLCEFDSLFFLLFYIFIVVAQMNLTTSWGEWDSIMRGHTSGCSPMQPDAHSHPLCCSHWEENTFYIIYCFNSFQFALHENRTLLHLFKKTCQKRKVSENKNSLIKNVCQKFSQQVSTIYKSNTFKLISVNKHKWEE